MAKLTSTLKYCGIISVVYVLLVFLLPTNATSVHNYHLTSTAYHLLLFVVVLPLIAIWFGAFYSYARLRQYSEAIADTGEGEDFAKLTKGFTWLAWGSVLTAIITLVMNAGANSHRGLHGASLIITNYVSILVSLISYTYISNGTRSLNERARITISNTGSKRIILSFMLIGVAYCFTTFRYLNLHTLNATNNPYYLQVWLVILTVVVPYLYSWFIGLLAAYEIYLYSKHVGGLLYQRAIRLLSFGVIAIIISSIAVQYLRVTTPRTGHLSLTAVLLVLNVVYIFMGAGYISLSLGTRQLRKIEEV